MKFASYLAAGVALVTMVPTTASAVTTINLDVSQNFDNQPYSSIAQTFTLPTNFTNASFNITSLSSDDAAVAVLNGTALYGAGIFGPGTGNFYFTSTGSSVPFTFGLNGASGGSLTAPFVAGLNTFTLIVNNNNAGINTNNGPLTSGPSGVDFVGNVTFDVTAVPEPSTWAMMLLGFGMIGFAARRRSSVKTTVRFA